LFTVVIWEFLVAGALDFGALKGPGDLAQPLSAQAQTPSRPSGADKKQPAEKQGGHGRSRNRLGTGGIGRSTLNSVLFAANQHCQTLWKTKFSAKTIDGSLPERAFRVRSKRETWEAAMPKDSQAG
jgi:hypothetical protein